MPEGHFLFQEETHMGKAKEKAKIAHIRAHVAEPYQKEIRLLKSRVSSMNEEIQQLRTENHNKGNQIRELTRELQILQRQTELLQGFLKLPPESMSEIRSQIEDDINRRKSMEEAKDLFKALANFTGHGF